MRARLARLWAPVLGPLRAVGAVLARQARLTLVLAVVLAVASVTAAVVVWLSMDDELDSERIQEARGAAEIAAVRLFSFGASTLDDDLAKARAVLTPELAANFDNDIAGPTREQVAATPGVENRVIVAASGVTSEASAEEVQVLLQFNRIIRLPDQQNVQTIRFAALLTMQESGDDWKVASVIQL